jgi:O-antigen/teichoic acid export membrane protein
LNYSISKEYAEEISKKTAILYIGNIAPLIISFLYLFLVPRIFGSVTYSTFVFIVSIFTSIALFTGLGFESVFNRFIPEYDLKREYKKIRNLLKKSFIFRSGAIMVTFFIGFLIIYLTLNPYIFFLLLILPTLFASSFYKLISAGIYGLKDFKKYVFLDILVQFFRLFFVLSFFIWFGIYGAVFALFPTYLFTFFISFYWFYKNVLQPSQKTEDTVTLKEIFKFSIPNYISSIFINFYLPSLVFITVIFFGVTEKVGFYFLVISMTQAIIPFILVFIKAAFPYLVDLHMKNQKRQFDDFINYVIKLSSMISFYIFPFFILFGAPILQILLGNEYLGIIPLLQVALIVLLIVGIGSPYRRIANVYKKTKINQFYAMVFYFTVIGSSILLAPLLQYFGIIIAYLLGYVVASVYVVISLYKISRTKINFARLGKIGFASLVSGIGGYSMNLMVDQWVAILVYTGVYLSTLILLRVLRKLDLELLKSLFSF